MRPDRLTRARVNVMGKVYNELTTEPYEDMAENDNTSVGVTSRNVCSECGAVMPEGTTGCQDLFWQVSVREYSDAAYLGIHRLTVDCYALQHPDRYCRSAKSLAAHLTGICRALEYGENPNVSRALSSWLNGTPKTERLAPPVFKGQLTITCIHCATSPKEYIARVWQWANSIWDAWAEHQLTAHRWIEEAIGR